MKCAGKTIATITAAAAWLAAAADMMGLLDLTLEQSQFALCVALAMSAGVMLCIRRRPLGDAYDMGYENGRRDALRASNGPGGGGRLVQFERKTIEPLRAAGSRN